MNPKEEMVNEMTAGNLKQMERDLYEEFDGNKRRYKRSLKKKPRYKYKKK